MEILKNFGFEPILFFAQIVNFLIIFLIMKKFLYKPLLKVMNDRKQKIEEGLRSAEQSNILLTETIKKEQEILKNAQLEAKKLLAEAKTKHDAIIQQTEEETKKRIERMLADAKAQIYIDTAAAEKRLRQEVARVSARMLEQSLTGFFASEDQEAIIKKALKNLKKKVD